MRVILRAFTMAALALAGAALAAAGGTADRIVAIAGGEPIMLSDLERNAGRHVPTAQLNEMLNEIIKERLLAQAARKEGFRDRITDAQIDEEILRAAQREGTTVDNFYEALKEFGFSVESYRKLVGDRLAQQELINRKVGPRVVVSPEDVAKYYKEHTDEFRKPERVHVRMVSVFLNNFKFDDPARRREEAKKQIDLVVQKLKDKQDMQYVAKEYSQDTYAAKGGDWGWVAKDGALQPALANKAFELQVGQISDVITTSEGYHVMKVEEREPAHLQSFGQVQEDIRQKLSVKRLQALRDDYVTRLWEKTCVEQFIPGR